ncbi:hypothetical protein HYT33_04000, partial [Candidatus Roizmanbacteria bacterium]|nr:hypothetical protein [Candidatus Roizmanbacteria bacterium]
MTAEQVDLRKHRGEPELRADELRRRKVHLLETGFPGVWVEKLAQLRPTLYSPHVVDEHIAGLQQRGFRNPRKMIETLPPILGYAFENIDAKLEGLQQRGFRNPTKMV